MKTSVLTTKGQVLIPKRIRDKYGMKAGMKVIFEETNDGVIIKPINEQFIKSFRGILSSTGNLKQELKEMKAEEK